MYYQNHPKHKVFISFYHHDDQTYKSYIDRWLSYQIINKSVSDGEYDTENSDEYIKRLIREEKVSDSSVVVVLVGPHTKHRKHVDWEIYAGLRASINGNSGLIAIMLPETKRADGEYYYDDLPARLSDNIKSGYADWYEWTYAIQHFDQIIEQAYDNRITRRKLIDNSRQQMKYNTGG